MKLEHLYLFCQYQYVGDKDNDINLEKGYFILDTHKQKAIINGFINENDIQGIRVTPSMLESLNFEKVAKAKDCYTFPSMTSAISIEFEEGLCDILIDDFSLLPKHIQKPLYLHELQLIYRVYEDIEICKELVGKGTNFFKENPFNGLDNLPPINFPQIPK